MRRSSRYVGVGLVAGALVLGCGKAGKRDASSQKGQDANAAASPAPALSLDLGGGVKMELVRIPAGEFVMGSPASEAQRRKNECQHRVRITKPFYIGKYEVTQAQYERIVGTNPSNFKGSELPVDTVSWNDATEFCRKLSERSARKARVPTETEWEYACRAGTTTPFHYGRSLSSTQGNFNGKQPYGGAAKGTYRGRTTNGGSFPANAWALHDMHGNVFEWCADGYDKRDKGYYARSPEQDPSGPGSKSFRVLRGGSWGSSGRSCRSADRIRYRPTFLQPVFGFRAAVAVAGR